MGKRFINGSDLASMAISGADFLLRYQEYVNGLNVFPVPDGDTGTNMSLTMSSGVKELKAKQSEHIGKAAEALSKGLLMGARGNSGVILSQLFRGFARSLSTLKEASAVDLAHALQHGVDMAYKAVVKPVEGTILTVAKEAAKHAVHYAGRATDIVDLLRQVEARAFEALQRTPEQLPVLKQVGVVDSGGQGLVYIYRGFFVSLSRLSGEEWPFESSEAAPPEAVSVPVRPERSRIDATSAQSRLHTEDITFLYDMEFFIKRNVAGSSVAFFDESAYKELLAQEGDSILVIAEDDIIKVHVHSRKPGDVLNASLSYGELTDIHILNMREQHREIVGDEPEPVSMAELSGAELLSGHALTGISPGQVFERAPYGIIAVALGDGLSDMFLASDVDTVLSGGQTMNPSTEDFMKAIDALSADHLFLLPNNSNIILAAEQAAEMSERNVTVIPTKTIPQGLAAVMAFKEDESPARNAEWMKNAASSVASGQVTKAVRDTSIEDVVIREGDYIGIMEKDIVAADVDLLAACKALLGKMLAGGGDLLTVLTGEDAAAEATEALCEWAETQFPELEIEIQHGGQPLYPYLFSAE